jgi:7-carboxy-7-deazaguanine synthase
MALSVTETFYSIMGESSFAGQPGFFIRLTGCNLRCRWCDTSYAYAGGKSRTLSGLIEEVHSHQTQTVLVTGGEPLLQDESLILLNNLAELGYTVLLETNGSRPIKKVDSRVHRIIDLKCPSSGMAAHNYLDNLTCLTPRDELKLVISSRADFDWAVNLLGISRPWMHNPVWLSPVSGILLPDQLADWILNSRLPLRLNLQIHKYIWGPEMRGV